MSTSVTPDEYAELHVVQRGNIGLLCECEGPCQHAWEAYNYYENRRQINQFHNAFLLCATPDNRSIALCEAAAKSLRVVGA